MKRNSLYIASIALAAVALGSCDNEFERPPMVVPVSTWQANTTIEDLKAEYWSTVEGTPVTVGLNAKGDSIVVKGRVCSSDQSGNIFKYLFIQGEEESLALSLDFYDIYESYKFGQEVYVNLTGLTIGGYSGLMCVGNGVDDRGRVARCAEAIFTPHAQANGLPDVRLVDTVTTTIPTVDAAKASAEGLQTWQSRLVRFDNVRFENAGEPFAVGTTSNNRYIIDESGNRINVYNSTYADFKDEILPSGYGSVVGILSYFGTNWQILLIDAQGCIGFNGVSAPVFSPAGGTVKPATEVTITCATEGAEIHYTLDGSDPTINSSLYTAPLVINEDVIVKAIATLEGHDASDVVTAKFTVSADAPAEGDGSEEKPYTTAQIIALNPTSTQDAVASGVWAQGYIVGYIPTGGSSTTISMTVFGNSGSDIAASNLVIAPSKDEKDYNNCIAVQLVTGSDIRSALNLKDHPENLGKLLTIKGDVMKYCGAAGIKAPSAYKLDGEGSGTVTPDPAPEGSQFKAVSAITSGKKYALVADGKVALSFGSKTYGYMNVSDVTVSDNAFTGNPDNSFTFTQVDGGYTIQGNDGRYIYMTGTYNSFNLDASQPASGAVWTVTFADGKATITNVEMNKSIQFDSQFNSYGSYPDVRGTFPTLYELVD